MPSLPSRGALREAFVRAQRWDDAECAPLAADASFRRYSRLLRPGGERALLMDAPPPAEDAGAFVALSRHLQSLGVRVPAIYAADVTHGFVLLEDLGDDTFSRLLDAGHAPYALYRRAVDALSHIRAAPRAVEIEVPHYTTERALEETELLLDWYLPAHTGRAVTADARARFADAWRTMLGALPPLPPTLVLRDYHIDNLMLCAGECALLDYQDALIGSPAYDLASLLEDARRDLAPSLRAEMLRHYHAANPDLNRAHFHQHYLVWAAQRHCKVAGIFVRLSQRDGKDGYLKHLPRVLALLRRHLDEPPLAPLRGWVEVYLPVSQTTPVIQTKPVILER